MAAIKVFIRSDETFCLLLKSLSSIWTISADRRFVIEVRLKTTSSECVEVLKNIKMVRLAYMLVITLATVISCNLAQTARGETTDSVSPSPETIIPPPQEPVSPQLVATEKTVSNPQPEPFSPSESPQQPTLSIPQEITKDTEEEIVNPSLVQSEPTPEPTVPPTTDTEQPQEPTTPESQPPQTLPTESPTQSPDTTPESQPPQTPPTESPTQSPDTTPESQPPQTPPTESPTQSPDTTPESQPPQTPPTESPTQSPDTTETEPAEEPKVLVAEVDVTGANIDLENLIYNTIRTRPGRTTTRSQLQEDINAIYATGYFANVKVTPEDTPLGVRVLFAVEPNPTFNQVRIQIVPEAQTEQILPQTVIDETFQDQYGKILNLRDLQEGVKKINEWYSQNGYDLAQVVGSPQIQADGTVTLIIAEGLIENIQVRYFNSEDEPVKGRTRQYVIKREMQLKPGNVFNRNTAQRDLQRVFGLGLFEDVRLSFEPGSDPREVVVNVDVVEGRTGSLAAGAGFSSNSGLFGSVSYQQQNLGGNNQTLGAEVQIGERELLFDLNFTDPWIYGDPYRTSYTINAFRRRSISLVFDGEDSTIRTANGNDSPRVVRTGGGVTFVRPLAPDVFSRADWILSTGFTYQQVQLENADGDIAPLSSPGFGSQRLAFSRNGIDDLFILSFAAARDYRDNPLQPTSGSLLRFGMEQTIPVGSGNIFFNRIRGSYSYYIPIRLLNFDFMQGPQTVAFNVQAGTVFGDLPPYEAFVVGGSNSVRGYAEGEVGSGRSFFQATAEYRFPIVSIVGGALFVDYGTTIGSQGGVPGQPGERRGLPGSGLGYGFGVRIQSPVGPIRIDYGFNDQGDSRLNFGIGERF